MSKLLYHVFTTLIGAHIYVALPVPGIALGFICILTELILTTSHELDSYSYLHFKGEETEAWEG